MIWGENTTAMPGAPAVDCPGEGEERASACRDAQEAASIPELTIVVPTYKRPVMLAAALRSIQRQSFGDYTVLVCDNSPECEGRAVVENLHDERFVYTPRGRNLGILNNVLAGFRAARSDLVMEVDDDDELYEHCLAELIAPFRTYPDLAVSFADVDVVDVEGALLPMWQRLNHVPLPSDLDAGLIQPFTRNAARGDVLMVSSVLRRTVVDWDNVPPDVGTAYDRYLGLSASRGGRAAHYSPQRLVAYRVHPQADTRMNTGTQFHGALRALCTELALGDADDAPVIRRQVVRIVFHMCRIYRAQGQYREVFATLRWLTEVMPAWDAVRYLADEAGPVQVRNWLEGRLARREVAAAIRAPVGAAD